MTDDELQGIVARAISDAEDYDETAIKPRRERLQRYYKGEPFAGDHGITEKDGQSQFVSRDVHDTVHAILPSLIDAALGPERLVEFVPRRPEGQAAAEQATDYVNYLIREENDGFGVLYAAIKDSLYQVGGVVQYGWDESPRVEFDEFSGLSPEQFQALFADPKNEILNPEQDEDGLISCEVRRTDKTGRFWLAAVPGGEFRIARDALRIDTASCVGRSWDRPVSDLVREGYDFDEMVELAGSKDDDSEKYERNNYGEDGETRDDPAMRLVAYHEYFIRVDFDGDGVAELRRICAAGPTHKVLSNKPANFAPFADFAADPTPHTFWGDCPGDAVAEIQRGKSQTIRLGFDSLVQNVHPRQWAVDGQVNMDDLLSSEIGGVVRVRSPGMVGEIPTGNSSSMVMPFLAMLDEVKENRTGQSKASAGLSADALQSTTRLAAEMTREGAQRRVKLILRSIAERGLKALFKGALRTVHRHQDPGKLVQLRGEWVDINPAVWDPTMEVKVNPAVGNGNVEEKQQFLQATLAIQKETMTSMGPQNPLTNFSLIYNTLADLARLHGKHVSHYFTQPPEGWQPQPPPPQPNPLVEAEKIKAEIKFKSDMAKIQSDADFDRDKLIVSSVNEAIKNGLPAELLGAYAAQVADFINRPRVDMGTQMGAPQ